jgi:membrane-bound lytic murein transglycosylase B
MKHFVALCIALLLSPVTQALDISRPEVRTFIDSTVREFGFQREMLQSLLKQAETKQPIIDAITRPAERVVPWFEYRDRFLTATRINQGLDFWQLHAPRLQAVSDPDLAAIVAGILGVETSFGRFTGKYRVLDALVTLAFDYPPRADFFRGELQQFLVLTREEAIEPTTALGSYAGAMGAPQFIASSYRKYAVDADGDGHRDLWQNWDDIIGSVANYLEAFGWHDGEPVTVPAMLPKEDLGAFDTSKVELNETVQSLRDKGVKFSTSLPDNAPAMLIVAQGKDGNVYRVGFNNFFVITRYNRSPMYAMAVNDLGNAIRNFMRDVAN